MCIHKKAPAFARARMIRAYAAGFSPAVSPSCQRMNFYELHPAGRGDFADRLLVVLHERLLGEHVLGVKIPHPAFDHLFDDVVRLAFLAGLLGEDRPLLFDERLIELGRGRRLRLHGRDVHGDALGQLVVAAFDLEQHAALGVVMHVAAGRRIDAMNARQPKHLAHLAFDLVLPLLQRRALAARRRLLPQLFRRLCAGPVASCFARSLASATKSSCLATGADSTCSSIIAPTPRLEARVDARCGLLRCCDPGGSP